MAKQELFERSPIRAFDQVTNGGLKAGEMGLVSAKKGLGKTSVLVQFGMDTLLNGKQLVHVSFDQHSENVSSWYDSIFTEISKKNSIANPEEVKEQIFHNRVILNVNQDNVNLEKVVNTLNALKAAGIDVAGVVIDGVDFTKVNEAEVQAVASYAKATKSRVWISATATTDDLEGCAPKDILPYFAAVVNLVSQGSVTDVKILKVGNENAKSDAEASLKLDSKTLLISK